MSTRSRLAWSFKDENVNVTAFNGEAWTLWTAFGYRFNTPDRVIVIAGDTTPKGEVVENCHECDVLIYEAYTLASFEKVSTEWKQYR